MTRVRLESISEYLFRAPMSELYWMISTIALSSFFLGWWSFGLSLTEKSIHLVGVMTGGLIASLIASFTVFATRKSDVKKKCDLVIQEIDDIGADASIMLNLMNKNAGKAVYLNKIISTISTEVYQSVAFKFEKQERQDLRLFMYHVDQFNLLLKSLPEGAVTAENTPNIAVTTQKLHSSLVQIVCCCHFLKEKSNGNERKSSLSEAKEMMRLYKESFR